MLRMDDIINLFCKIVEFPTPDEKESSDKMK